MAEAKNTIIVLAPEGVHVKVVRGHKAEEATHEVLASWELRLLVQLVELHVTRVLTEHFGEGIAWDWTRQEGWRELLPLNGQAHLRVYLAADEGRMVLVRRIGDMNFAVQEEERIHSLRPS